jgi:uncharacterized RDD family membrane protein YckC
MLLDFFSICFISLLVTSPFILFDTVTLVTGKRMPFSMAGPLLYVHAAVLSLYLCKDSINGRSLAKRILGHQVVDNKTGQVATPLQCLVRNILIIIWPVEVIVVQVNPARRLGDKLAGTKVVTYDPALEQPRVKPAKLVVPFIIAWCCLVLIGFPYGQRGPWTPWTQRTHTSKAPVRPQLQYDTASYNARESKELRQLYKDSANDNLEISPSVYDKTGKPGTRCILIDYYERAAPGQGIGDSSVKAMITKYLYARYPEDSITGLARKISLERKIMNGDDDDEIYSFPIGKVYPR